MSLRFDSTWWQNWELSQDMFFCGLTYVLSHDNCINYSDVPLTKRKPLKLSFWHASFINPPEKNAKNKAKTKKLEKFSRTLTVWCAAKQNAECIQNQLWRPLLRPTHDQFTCFSMRAWPETFKPSQIDQNWKMMQDAPITRSGDHF